jgi:hypothetical protein
MILPSTLRRMVTGLILLCRCIRDRQYNYFEILSTSPERIILRLGMNGGKIPYIQSLDIVV